MNEQAIIRLATIFLAAAETERRFPSRPLPARPTATRGRIKPFRVVKCDNLSRDQ